ncbi:sulfur carrier protein ThiS [Granulicella mallensis]|uniref:Thiamine biosynthesis protein ThiS n=1 Tax=Granulicella mallensis (strain ATCC BAA-1857 / DSM 23137 / MP5ACTX8) TaxID=682795 RepID=G8NY88_GRAMM|nr:sulfur carrier protein ThiS [Granulicella mallensis]AEU36762.1 thiamine biosynthesis protein ThiS [Granulicella mallensis MP5ACTX8]
MLTDMTLQINGQTRSFPEPVPSTLDQVLLELGMKADRIAVERNGEIVPRTQWSETAVQSGDRLEVVHFVGGGSSASS